MSSKKYLNQSFTIVRRVEDALFSAVAGFPLPSSPNLELTFRTSVSFCSETHISFHLMHEPVLGAGQENAQSCDWEKLQSKGALKSCRPFHGGAFDSLVSESKCHLQHKLVVSLPLYVVFIIFDSHILFGIFLYP